MDEQSKQGKSTGPLSSASKGVDGESLRLESTERSRELPLLKTAHSGGGSKSSILEVSLSGPQIMALLIMSKDFQALQEVSPQSRMISKDGKIYWRVSIPGVDLTISETGNLLADGVPINVLVKNLLAGK